jgi:hypothetical protein
MTFLRTHRAASVIAAAASVALVALPAAAVQIVPSCALSVGTAPPGIDCIMQTFVGIAQIILGITGSFALLMFVYGGFLILSSAGDSGKVDAGKTVLRNALIGIVVIFTAGYVVQYAMRQLQGSGGSADTQQVRIGEECADGQGRTFTDRGDQCFRSCGDLGNYACKVPNASEEASCYAGLCPGAANVRCCPN